MTSSEPIRDPLELEAIDRSIRINELEEQLKDLGVEAMHVNDDCPPEVRSQFLSGIVEFETATIGCRFDQLAQEGVELPRPDSMDEATLHCTLWKVINALAARDVYLERTDHLSDRELYERLWGELLREEVPIMPPGSGWINHIDILGGCSEEDIKLSQKYYDDDETRAHWARDFPDDAILPHEDPPFQRDRLLPKPPVPEFMDDGAGEIAEDSDEE